jgi:SpoVK/Ycf46/Vps4 family AAA+-type ATPase
MTVTQWRDQDGAYIAVGETIDELPSGIYDVAMVPQVGLVWIPLEARNDELLRFEDSVSARVVDEIRLFWEQEEAFRRYKLPYKRGILLHGPPGSGKSSTLRIICDDVVDRGGYVIQFTKPSVLVSAVRQLRQIHRNAEVVVLMEDVDAILDRGDESSVLNLLDGAEQVDRMVFLATTNYPEKLGERIRNRPSRFDRRVLVSHPTSAMREQYLRAIALPADLERMDLERYVKDSDGMSLAHVKELFIATHVLRADYDTTVADLRGMAVRPTSTEDGGFERPGRYA